MSRQFQFIAIGVAILSFGAVEGRGSDDQDSSLRFIATFTSFSGTATKPAELAVVFVGEKPDASKAEIILHKCVEAALALDGTKDIVAKGWHRTSVEIADRQPIMLVDSAIALAYNAADKSISRLKGNAAESRTGGQGKSDANSDVEAIFGNLEVQNACKKVAPERLTKLIEIAIENRGERRSQIVRGVRKWCKANSIDLDREMSLCVSSISKATHQDIDTPVTTAADAEASAARGAIAYKTANCAKCHRNDGRGGQRAPDLTDAVWDHCDGSVDGIRKVLAAGVSESQLKDPNRPFAMNPVTRFSKDELTDLASYVQSLGIE